MLESLTALALCAAVATAAVISPPSRPAEPRAPWVFLFLVSMVLALVAGRWPVLQANRPLINVDEAQMLAGALTLIHDPVFWRSVDGTSQGPLNQWPLTGAALLGMPLDYRSARVFALILWCVTLGLVSLTLLREIDAGIALLALVPPLALAATTRALDLMQYSSELVPMTLCAAAVWLGWARADAPSNSRAFIFGAVIMSIPMAKLQAVVPAAGLGALWLWQLWQVSRIRRFIMLIGAAVSGFLLVFLLCAGPAIVTGHWDALVLTFFRANYAYNADHAWRLINPGRTVDMAYFLALVGGCIATALALTGRRLLRYRLAPVAFVFLVCSVAAVVIPGRGYHHYWLLVIPPATLLLGLAVPLIGAHRGRGLRAALAIAAISPFVLKLSLHRSPLWERELDRDRADRAAVELIRKYASPGDSLAVWGWRYHLYVETHLPQASPHGHTEGLIQNWGLQADYRRRYLEHLREKAPTVFADETGPTSIFYRDRDRFGHERFPLIADWVAANYHFAGEADGVRVYRKVSSTAAEPRSGQNP